MKKESERESGMESENITQVKASYRQKAEEYLNKRILVNTTISDCTDDYRGEWPVLSQRYFDLVKLSKDSGIEADISKLLYEYEVHQIELEMQIGELRLESEKAKTIAQKYLALIELAPDAFFQGDSVGNFITVNTKAVELTGFSKEELLSMNMGDLFTANVMNDNPLRYDLLNLGRTIRTEREFIRKTGEIVYIEMNSKAMPDGTYQCFVRDVTDCKLSEEALQASEEKYRLLIDESSDPIFAFKPDGEYRYVNTAFADGVGKKRDEIVGRKIWDVFSKDEADKRFAAVKWVFENGQEKVLEVRVPRPDGDRFYITTVKPIFNDQSEVISVICISKEITDRKRVEEALVISQEKFRQLIENSFDMIVLLDENGIQHFVSESCKKILGYSPDELINIPVIETMIHPEDQKRLISEFQKALENGFGGAQYRHRHKNGGWVCLEGYGTNQLNNPYINSVVFNVRDVTERKKAEQVQAENEAHLRELNATKDKFFSIIAHDLKSPFNSIMGFSNILFRQIQEKDYDGIEKYASIIQNSSQRAMDLLLNLMEWSKSQTGKMEFSPEYIDIVAYINGVAELLIYSAEEKSITLYSELPPGVTAFADPAMINTILRNLITNAIKFTDTNGEIVISAVQKKDELLVSIRDTGVGISKDAIEKLFRIDKSMSTYGTRNEKGTGLGLILCKEFVEKHGGKIWVESEVRKGSIFWFTIPNI